MSGNHILSINNFNSEDFSLVLKYVRGNTVYFHPTNVYIFFLSASVKFLLYSLQFFGVSDRLTIKNNNTVSVRFMLKEVQKDVRTSIKAIRRSRSVSSWRRRNYILWKKKVRNSLMTDSLRMKEHVARYFSETNVIIYRKRLYVSGLKYSPGVYEKHG